MNASHGVPVKASTDGRSKKFAITIAQSQRAKRASGDRMIFPLSSMSEVLKINYGLTFSKTIRNSTSFQDSFTSIEEEFRTQATTTPVGHRRGFRQGQGAESFVKAMCSSNSVRSMVQRMSSGACWTYRKIYSCW